MQPPGTYVRRAVEGLRLSRVASIGAPQQFSFDQSKKGQRMPANILLLTATTSRFMGAVADSAEEGANQGGAIVSTKELAGLCAVDGQPEREWRTCEFVQLEDLLDFDCVLLLLHGRNDAARAVYFLKRAGELSQYKHFVGKLGSVFFVPGASQSTLKIGARN
ncbi:hypothetical protein ACVMB3_004798 [Sinorhizobium meliloti]|uniref:hypothetical protein n=1 Tax=Rhizobium meliloti TaxID=382 RepID=UPI0004F7C0B0|nr:hypothetical protein [Sinorhizobium meliloti]AIM02387.1 hypothetical protein DU99_24610 [Sinorhizobium meliloti]ASQ02109.1 hypothetical protein CDO24_33510 [Sinorhizobium meliloti]MDW9410556.1 hypothetical protein [Sinorhizobium meliloti]MDW9443431.1 hypothetical protein [Sinorhizobium meliloti]MDW9455931.1 hypothetical protein [Sinorhizobium meliloti]